jgi:alkylation response protein AidB-like acyl-CoA dehydrogenase
MAAAIYPMPANYLNGIRLPANIEADEWDGFHDLIVLDEVARCGYLGVIWGLACGNSIGAPPLINFGNEEQKERFLPKILNGSIRFCLAVTEPDGELPMLRPFPLKPECWLLLFLSLAGSDVAGLLTTAERRGDKYIVNGAKKWITNGVYADYCTAAVRTGGEGRSGVSALIIPLKAPGVTCRKMENSGVAASGKCFQD